MLLALALKRDAALLSMSGLLFTLLVVMILVGRENHQRLADYIGALARLEFL